jgi:hypothetical protein
VTRAKDVEGSLRNDALEIKFRRLAVNSIHLETGHNYTAFSEDYQYF